MITTTATSETFSFTPGAAPASFAISFGYQLETEICASLSEAGLPDLTLNYGTDFSLSTPASTGGTLTRLTTWNSAYGRITIYRSTALVNENSLLNGSALDGPTTEKAIDELVQMVQEQTPDSARTIHAPATDLHAPKVLPSDVSRALKYLAFDANGDPIATDSAIPTATPVDPSWTSILSIPYSGEVNVKWFGAVGDGTTDDTAAIQAAIDSLGTYTWKGSAAATEAQATGGLVFFPSGKYKISSTIWLPGNIRLQGAKVMGDLGSGGGTILFAKGFASSDCYAVDVKTFSAAGTLLTGFDPAYVPATATYTTSVELRDLEIRADTSGSTVPKGGLRAFSNIYGRYEVTIKNFAVGLYLGYTFATRIRCYILAGWYGIAMPNQVVNGVQIDASEIDMDIVNSYPTLNAGSAPSWLLPSQSPVTDTPTHAYYRAGIYAYNACVLCNNTPIQHWDSAVTAYWGQYQFNECWFESNVYRDIGNYQAYMSFWNPQTSSPCPFLMISGGRVSIGPSGYSNGTGGAGLLSAGNVTLYYIKNGPQEMFYDGIELPALDRRSQGSDGDLQQYKSAGTLVGSLGILADNTALRWKLASIILGMDLAGAAFSWLPALTNTAADNLTATFGMGDITTDTHFRAGLVVNQSYDAGTGKTYFLFQLRITDGVSQKVVVGGKKNGTPTMPNLSTYANNAAALAGGLVAGDLYRTNADPDIVCVVH